MPASRLILAALLVVSPALAQDDPVATAAARMKAFPVMQSVGCADVESYTVAGTGVNDLNFVGIAPAPLNFHLTAVSPATVRDVAGLTTCPGGDIDGGRRSILSYNRCFPRFDRRPAPALYSVLH